MKKTVILVALMTAVVALTVVGAMAFRKHQHERFRREWKNKTVVEVAKWSMDTDWLAGQITKARSSEDGWFTDHLIVMTNGEWIVYGAECQKANPRIRDIFVGFGSDGKWYYTTFHFCVGMLDLEMKSQSEDLASFITKYCLVEFDGKSDEALKKTWPALYVGNPAESSRTTFLRREEVNGDDSAMLVVAVGVRVAIIAWLVYCIVRRVRLARREKAELRERIEGAIASIKADGKVEGPKGAYVPHHAWKAGTPHDTVPPKARSYDGGEWPD